MNDLHTPLKVTQKEVGEEGDIVLPRLICLEPKLLHHVCIASSRGKQEQATMVLSLVQALLCQLKLGLAGGQLGQLLPLLLTG